MLSWQLQLATFFKSHCQNLSAARPIVIENTVDGGNCRRGTASADKKRARQLSGRGDRELPGSQITSPFLE